MLQRHLGGGINRKTLFAAQNCTPPIAGDMGSKIRSKLEGVKA
jgi:hypothetical protein